MSVFKHEYRTYSGRQTSLNARIGVLARYGLSEVWASKITIALTILGLVPFIVFLVVIYLANNPLARALILRGSKSVDAMDADFFLRVLETQCWLGLVLSAWIAPRLITFDMADNALPILLSHPISRTGYVLGKLIALLSSLSLVTWIPCVLLFAYQGYSSPVNWFSANLRVGFGLVLGGILWISVLSIMSLALSSWVKWRVVATGIIFAAVFVPAGFGGIVTGVLHTKWGFLFNVPVIMTELWQRLLGAPEVMHGDMALPNIAILTVLAIVCAVSIAMLNARIRAREVVRG